MEEAQRGCPRDRDQPEPHRAAGRSTLHDVARGGACSSVRCRRKRRDGLDALLPRQGLPRSVPEIWFVVRVLELPIWLDADNVASFGSARTIQADRRIASKRTSHRNRWLYSAKGEREELACDGPHDAG